MKTRTKTRKTTPTRPPLPRSPTKTARHPRAPTRAQVEALHAWLAARFGIHTPPAALDAAARLDDLRNAADEATGIPASIAHRWHRRTLSHFATLAAASFARAR